MVKQSVQLPKKVDSEEEWDTSDESQAEEVDEVELEESAVETHPGSDSVQSENEEAKDDEDEKEENVEESEGDKEGEVEDDSEKEEEEEEEEEETIPAELQQKKTFESLGIDNWLVRALGAMAITSPTEIQRATIPEILAGRDVIGGAKTGSGKTAAFALPILQKLSEDPYGVFGLVLTPTRELAFQISEQFEVLGKGINLKICVCVGGMDMMTQALQLSRKPHIVIATPGRLADHMLSSANTNHFKRLRFLVMDEADRLLDPTFKPDLETIFENINKRRQTLLYTATMTEEILKMKSAKDGLIKNPHIYECDTRISTVSTLTQNYVFLPSYVREAYLVHLLQSDELKDKSTIIFVGRCQTAETIRSMLVELGIRCTGLHSMMNQNERLNSLGKFRSSVVPILIATDVGSRGLDIPTVQLVLNYNLPRDPTDYIHRVGRTARAGRGGRAISLVTEKDISLVHNIEARINKQLEEYKVSENKVLEILNEVSAAKRMATMHLHDNQFGSKQEVRKLKQKTLREAEKKRKRSSKKEAAKKIRSK